MNTRAFETQQPGQGPGLSSVERALATYLDVEIVRARRRSERDFDVEIDFIAPGRQCEVGWMPLVVLLVEWRRRPDEVGALAEAAGGRSAADCAEDWDYILDIDDLDVFMSMCEGVWALVCARSDA